MRLRSVTVIAVLAWMLLGSAAMASAETGQEIPDSAEMVVQTSSAETTSQEGSAGSSVDQDRPSAFEPARTVGQFGVGMFFSYFPPVAGFLLAMTQPGDWHEPAQLAAGGLITVGPPLVSFLAVTKMGARFDYPTGRTGALVGAFGAGAAHVGSYIALETRDEASAPFWLAMTYPITTALGATLGYHIQTSRAQSDEEVRDVGLGPVPLVGADGGYESTGLGVTGSF